MNNYSRLRTYERVFSDLYLVSFEQKKLKSLPKLETYYDREEGSYSILVTLQKLF